MRIINTLMQMKKRFATLFVRHPGPGTGALALPHEIILMITDHLDYASVVSLAWTCKILHAICFPHNKRPNMREMCKLLSLIEKERPNMYSCHSCRRLHQWHGDHSRHLFPTMLEKLPCCKPKEFHIAGQVAYHHARLVMNRHFYGPAHGLPLSKLSCFYQDVSDYNVMETEDLRARIVDDNLMVSSIIIIYHPKGDFRALEYHLDTSPHLICPHLMFRDSWRGRCLIHERDDDEWWEDCPSSCSTPRKKIRSCRCCPTDYCVEIKSKGRGRRDAVKISVYRQLGQCRSPYNWNWRSVSTLRSFFVEPIELRTARQEEYGLGNVMEQWKGGRRIEGMAQAEWV